MKAVLAVAIVVAGAVTGQEIRVPTVVEAASNPVGLVPIVPARLLETRPGLTTVDDEFAGAGPAGAGTTIELTVAGRAGIPSDATAAILNVTAVRPTDHGFLTVYPCDQPRPTASNVNYVPGDVTPNSVLAKLDASGRACIFTLATTHVLADATGYVPAGGSPTPIVPARLLETRPGLTTVDDEFAGAGPAGAGTTIELTVAGRAGIPSDATAAILNVTAVRPTDHGFLTVYPCDQPRPTASNVNYVPGDITPNSVLAKLDASGRACIFTLATTHVLADATGYVPAGGSPTPIVPARLLETRPGLTTVDDEFAGAGPAGAGTTIELTVAGRAGIPSDATAAILNVTAVRPTDHGFLTVYPCDQPRPTASNVNYVPGDVTPNSVLAKLDASGRACIFTLATTHVLADATGYVPSDQPLAALAEPSAERLAAGVPAQAGGVILRDELWITLGSPELPGARTDATGLAAAVGAQVIGGFEEFGIYQLRWPSAVDIDEKTTQINALRPDAVAGPSMWGGVGEAAEPPGDWNDDGPEGTWHLRTIDAPAAWDLTKGSSVRVGIVDTGTAFRGHEDLDVSFPSGHPTVGAQPHGTHVAGLACARANGKGVVGAAWGCPVVSAGFSGNSWYNVFAAALAVLDSDVKIINMSLGQNFFDASGNKRCATPSEGDAAETELRKSFSSLFAHLMGSTRGSKVVWTLAAGNNCVAGSQSPMAIAAADNGLPNVLIVEAANSDGSLASFSNFGTGPSIAAPGGVGVGSNGDGTVGLWSTTVRSCAGLFQCGGYGPSSGTSMAAPIVAGVAALTWERHPTKAAAQIVRCITIGAAYTGRTVPGRSVYPTNRVPTEEYNYFGTPLLSAKRAVDCPPDAPLCEGSSFFDPAVLVPCAQLRQVRDQFTVAYPDADCRSHRYANGQIEATRGRSSSPVAVPAFRGADDDHITYLDVWMVYRNSRTGDERSFWVDAVTSESGPLATPGAATCSSGGTGSSVSDRDQGTWTSIAVEVQSLACPRNGGMCLPTTAVQRRPTKPAESYSFVVPNSLATLATSTPSSPSSTTLADGRTVRGDRFFAPSTS
jgi:subtilisin family serine protease